MYYRRYKTPLSQSASHKGLDQSKVGLARWYGPARVLATETKGDYEPYSRKPGSTVWVIGGGRLKRCSPQQLRHCSERERILAESSESVTMPWSFNSLMHLVERGQYDKFDDLIQDEQNPSFREREARRDGRSRSRGRSVSRPREMSLPVQQKKEKREQRPQQEPKEQVERPQTERERRPRSSPVHPHGHDEKRQKKTEIPKGANVRETKPPLFQHPPFLAAQERASAARSSASSSMVAPECETESLLSLLQAEKSYVVSDSEETFPVYQVEVELPQTRKEMKSFVKDSETWVARRLKKGAELRWQDIPKSRLADFQKAKEKEVSSWIQQSVVKLVHKQVPQHRVMKMRWLYTLKADNSAKARIVIVGFTDPDIGTLHKTSPTMSRRTRGLFLTICGIQGWTALKGDVKAAFLQSKESEEERQIFSKPVSELNERLGGGPNSLVQIVKAAYRLANAPAQWFHSVAETMQSAGFEQLKSEPCCWRVMDRTDPSNPQLIGLACAHVDDFLFGGDGDNPMWQTAISKVFDSYRWSDWEVDNYAHCGVQITQHVDGSTVLSQSDYCADIDQIKFQDRHDHLAVTEEEKQQLRGVLGALQWRVYQTAPQHGARLSALQSQLAAPTVATLRAANKLVRDAYNGRHVNLQYKRLDVRSLEDVTFVSWTDAAVGNRRDLSSSGGYLIGACEPKIAEGMKSQINMVSWKAGRLPRVAPSSLSAEIQAFSIAEEELMYVRLQYLEMIGHDLPLIDPATIVQRVKGIMVTDAKSLYDVIQKGPMNTSGLGLKEKYSVLDMLSVFQRLSKCSTETRWVHSEAQLADAMTKHVPGSALIRVLQEGTWTLKHDPQFISAKRLKKQRSTFEASARVFGACEMTCLLEPELPPLPMFAHFQMES